MIIIEKTVVITKVNTKMIKGMEKDFIDGKSNYFFYNLNIIDLGKMEVLIKVFT
jgi:hypothetical protein